MRRFISRDPFESDRRVGFNWWLKEEDACEYCIQKNSKTCDYCAYNKKKRFPYVFV